MAVAPVLINAQAISDTSINVHMASLHLGYYVPGGDFADRYGKGGIAGVSYFFKHRSNWIMELQYDYIFGEGYKEMEIFDPITSKEGLFFNKDGSYLDMASRETGFFTGVKIGRIIPVFGSNPNSGILIQAGLGFMQYKTYLEGVDEMPLLEDEHMKGYDRLSNGLSINQFIGYMHIGNDNKLNFFAGFEFYQAWTSNRRDFDFYAKQKINDHRKDFLFSIKAGWIIHFTSGKPDKYYFN